MLIEYKRKQNGDVSFGIGNHAVPAIICIVLALLVIALIVLGVSPSDVWGILRSLEWK